MTDPSQLTNEQLLALAAQQSPPPQGASPAPVQANPLPPIPGAVQSPVYADPSGLSNDQLLAAAANSNPNMSVPEDVARSAATGLNLGAAGVVGGFGDAAKMGGDVGQWLVSHAAHAMGVPDARTKPANLGHPGAVTSSDMNALLQDTTGPYHQPQSTPGKYAQTIASFWPAAVAGPASIPGRVAAVALPGTLSEGAGQGAEALHLGSGWETALRTLGALAGGGLTHIGGAVANGPTRAFADAIRNAPTDQIGQAQNIVRNAAALPGGGVSITPLEAVAQATNNGTGAMELQHYIENNSIGREITKPYFGARPQQVQNVGRAFIDSVAPATDQPSMIGTRAQGVAQDALDQTRQGINAEAQPHYDAMAGEVRPNPSGNLGGEVGTQYIDRGGQSIPAEAFNYLTRNQAFQQSLREVRRDPLLNAGIAQLPDNDVSVLNEVQKQIDRNIEAQRQTATNPGGNNYKASLFQNARDAVDSLGRRYSPQWAAARDTVSQGRATQLDPLTAGPLGGIASTDRVPAQTAALYPKSGAVLEGAPAETAQALQQMRAAELASALRNETAAPAPGVGADLTRQHLVNTFNDSTRNLIEGDNPRGGAKWIAGIAGNPEQRATLEAGLGVVAPGARQAWDPLLESLMATGKRLGVGSRTAMLQEYQRDFGKAPAPIRTLTGMLDPLEIGKHIDTAVGGAMYKNQNRALAQLLISDPEEAQQILARAPTAQRTNPLASALIDYQSANSGQR